MSAKGYPAGTIKPQSGMISLDLPPGTVSPVPGGVSDHHITVVYLGENVDDKAFAAACKRARAAAASAAGPITAVVGGVGTFPPSGSSSGKRPAFARVAAPAAVGRIRTGLADLSQSAHANWKPHVTLAYVGPGDPLPAPVPATRVKFTHLSVHRGGKVARFPLGGTADLAGDTPAVELSAQTPVLSTVHHPLGSPSGPGLFRVRGLQLPAYIQNIARALIRSGHPESQAIELAIGACQRWARGGGKVSPDVRAAAAKALAEWEGDKAVAHSHANDTGAVELAGVFTSALHPRIGAGATGGGRFASKNTAAAASSGKQPAAKGVTPKGVVQPGPVRPGGGRGEAVQLRAQAFQYREHAAALEGQIASVRSQLHAQLKLHFQALAASKKAAAASASGTKAASTTAAKSSTKTAKKSSATVKKAASATAKKPATIPQLRARLTSLRAQVKALNTAAGKLEAQAGKLEGGHAK